MLRAILVTHSGFTLAPNPKTISQVRPSNYASAFLVVICPFQLFDASRSSFGGRCASRTVSIWSRRSLYRSLYRHVVHPVSLIAPSYFLVSVISSLISGCLWALPRWFCLETHLFSLFREPAMVSGVSRVGFPFSLRFVYFLSFSFLFLTLGFTCSFPAPLSVIRLGSSFVLG